MKFKLGAEDITLIIGLSLIAYGLYQMYQPAASLFLGGAFIKFALGGSNG